MNFPCVLQICVSACVFYGVSTAKSDGPVVETRLGALRGEYVSVRGWEGPVRSFLGVPFAQPPLGPLRLKPPLPAESWESIRDATHQPFICVQDRQMMVDMLKDYQMDMELPQMSEDCLYLNIHTPALPKHKLPVMVWIHGGGFLTDSASIYDGSALAAYQNVVVVVVQYRLGILGFFSTGDKVAPGNLGLLDQVAALQWVQENIHSFGGDPDCVTLFGESAGGAAVSLLLLSPLSTGLVHRAIAQSGTADLKQLFNPTPQPVAQLLVQELGCVSDGSEDMLNCVRDAAVEEIQRIIIQNKNVVFGVTVDGEFLPKPVEELLQTQAFQKIPFITGVTNHEGGWIIPGFIAPEGWADGMDREAVVPTLSLLMYDLADQQLAARLLDQYLDWSADRAAVRDVFTEILGDLMFVVPAVKVARIHRDAGVPVYFYEFGHAPSMLAKNRPKFVKSDHGDELMFVFGNCFTTAHIRIKGSFTEEEEVLCRRMMSYWGNFARSGSPNGPGLVHWAQYGSDEQYLHIGLGQRPGAHLKEHLFSLLPHAVKPNQSIQHAEL
ncbi:fatty acyl-CoA hydrolase precursor, medium chain isoform X2 [Chanos chanos]|uniref:Carboxylic ester hydrolase n=1 Tax=Chanos chanos TaxID=29144 RepID=A0A6J2WIU1_CHACN|nr:fatty acyl-CoA hydrolase precursor, medium chain-like isoform X2 [Chanos chanos]